MRIDKGNLPLLDLHNKRLNHTRHHHFQSKDTLDLAKHISVPEDMKNEYLKCRIVYDEKIQEITYNPYQKKTINSLQVISSNLDYSWKYEDRKELKALFANRKEHDDILIIKEGLVTDSFYCNVAFFKNGFWFTPKRPLLHGVMRESLMSQGKITPHDIAVSDIKLYDKLCLFNAMIDFEETVIPIESVDT